MEPQRVSVAKSEVKGTIKRLAQDAAAQDHKFMAVGREHPDDSSQLELIFIPYPRDMKMAQALEINKKVSALFAQGFQTLRLSGDIVKLGNHNIAAMDANTLSFGDRPRPGTKPLG